MYNYLGNECIQRPNSWTYSFVEVSGHNLESSHPWRFCMDILKGVWHEIFDFSFFHTSVSPGPLSILLVSFRFFSKIRGDNREWMFVCGVNVSLKKYKWVWIVGKKTPKTFVWISSKNSASGRHYALYPNTWLRKKCLLFWQQTPNILFSLSSIWNSLGWTRFNQRGGGGICSPSLFPFLHSHWEHPVYVVFFLSHRKSKQC